MTKAFIEAVKNFSEAAQQLTKVWDEPVNKLAGAERYPFADSFDDIAHRIHHWELVQEATYNKEQG
jgi:hypothetical protein